MKPKITIVLAVYNCEDYLAEAIDSVLKQDFKDFELIIVNDGSIDSSFKIAKDYEQKDKRIKVINKKENSGRADSINKAIEIMQGEYLTFQDADDIMYPERLKKQFEFMEKNKDISMAYANMVVYWEEGGKKELYDAPEFENPLEKLKEINSAEIIKQKNIRGLSQFLDKNKYIPGTSVILRKNILDSGIRLDSKFEVAQDYDLWFQIIGHKYKIAKQNIVALVYRRHNKQVTITKVAKRMDSVMLAIEKVKTGKYFN